MVDPHFNLKECRNERKLFLDYMWMTVSSGKNFSGLSMT